MFENLVKVRHKGVTQRCKQWESKLFDGSLRVVFLQATSECPLNKKEKHVMLNERPLEIKTCSLYGSLNFFFLSLSDNRKNFVSIVCLPKVKAKKNLKNTIRKIMDYIPLNCLL